MNKHVSHGITVERSGADMFVTMHSPQENPLSLAAQKAGQLYGLLHMVCDYAAANDSLAGLDPQVQEGVLSLAAGLAREALALSEMAGVVG